MDSSVASTSPDRSGNDGHADSHSYQNRASSVSPANISEAVTFPNNEDPVRNSVHEKTTSVLSSSLLKNVSAGGDKVGEAETKRKRQVDDERTHGATSKRVAHEIGNHEKDYSSDESSIVSEIEMDELLRKLEAEEARRAALSPEARKKEDIKESRHTLKYHIKPQFICDMDGLPVGLHYYPRFILQLAPDSRNGSTCRFTHCTDRIKPGQYRIALTPGMSDPRGPDYYHVRCFENLLHMSSLHYAARFDADRQKYIPDRGARCILEEYISRWKLRLTQAQNHKILSSSTNEEEDGVDEDQNVRLHRQPSTAEAVEQQVSDSLESSTDNAGESANSPVVLDKTASIEMPSTSVRARQLLSAVRATVKKDKWAIADEMYERVRKVETEEIQQYDIFRRRFQNDNSNDESCPWNITQYLLSETHPKYSKRHALSQALKAWEIDFRLATTAKDKLTAAGLEAQANLPIEKIKRCLF